MYVIREQEKRDLMKYYPPKQLVSNRSELTIRNLDGYGSPIPMRKNYIVVSTQKLNEYGSVEELNKNLKRFAVNETTEDTCYATITPP